MSSTPHLVESIDAAYLDNLDFLASLENEIDAWVSAYESAQTGGAAITDRAALLAMADVRQRRLAASTCDMPWQSLVDRHALNALEQLILAHLFVLRESPHMANRIAQTSDGERSPWARHTDAWSTPARILAIYCEAGRGALESRSVFGADRPLFARGLLDAVQLGRSDSLFKEELRLTAETAAWILDDEATFSHLRAGIRVEWPKETLQQVVLSPERKALLTRVVMNHDDYQGLRQELGIDECEELLAPERGVVHNGPFLKLLEKAEGLVVLTTNRPVRMGPALERRILYRLAFNPQGLEDRIAIWHQLLPEPLKIPDDNLRTLAHRYALNGGYIKNAVLDAVQMLTSDPSTNLSNHERLNVITHAAATQAERLQEQCLSSATMLHSRPCQEGWVAPSNRAAVDDVVSIARLYVDSHAFSEATKHLPSRGLRVLLSAETLPVTLDAVDHMATALDLKVLEVDLLDLASATPERDSKNRGSSVVSTFLNDARLQHLLVVHLHEYGAKEANSVFTEALLSLSHMSAGAVVAITVCPGQPRNSWRRVFQRHIRLSSIDPQGLAYLRSLADHAGWVWGILELRDSMPQFCLPRDELRGIFEEATARAILAKQPGVMRMEFLEQARLQLMTGRSGRQEVLFGGKSSD